MTVHQDELGDILLQEKSQRALDGGVFLGSGKLVHITTDELQRSFCLIIDACVGTVELARMLAVAMDGQLEKLTGGAQEVLQNVVEALKIVVVHAQLKRADVAIGSNRGNQSAVKYLSVAMVIHTRRIVDHLGPTKAILGVIADLDMDWVLKFANLVEDLLHHTDVLA